MPLPVFADLSLEALNLLPEFPVLLTDFLFWPTDVVIDAGANIGDFTVKAAK